MSGGMERWPGLAVTSGWPGKRSMNWKVRYEKSGDEGLINDKPCPKDPGLRVAPELQEERVPLNSAVGSVGMTQAPHLAGSMTDPPRPIPAFKPLKKT